MSRLAEVYREAHRIPSNKRITLSLDGDTLENDTTVKELDLEDDDLLDVTIDNS